jgi:hypothetical protein
VLMLERPDVSPRALAPGALGAALVFVVYLLFIDGGVITVFLDDRKLGRGEFFENAGLFFWRMVRLALYSVLPFGLLTAAGVGIASYAGKLAGEAPQDRLEFFVYVAIKLVFLVASLFVRMWFDVAQARVVRDNESGVLRVLLRGLGPAFRSGRLFAKYIGIGLFAAAAFGLGVGVWFYLPHGATGASFLVLELVTMTQIASRLWLKAASARWVSLLSSEQAVVIEAPAPAMSPMPADLPVPE